MRRTGEKSNCFAMIKMKSNADQVIDRVMKKLLSISPGGVEHDKAMRVASSDLLGEMVVRIHVDGKASDDTDIGTYNQTSPLYINPADSPKSFTPAGKPKAGAKQQAKLTTVHDIKTQKAKKVSIHENHRERRTRYFDSYGAFRTFIGRDGTRVNLDLTGGLKHGLQVVPGPHYYGIGFANEEQTKRATGLEAKYKKKIWSLSAKEKQHFVENFSISIRSAFHS